MAPMTRSSHLVPLPDGLSNVSQSSMMSEREVSVDVASYDETDGEHDEEAGYYGKQGQLESPEDHEDVLHPLREAANRVGREVERFAEVLDGYNPLRTTEKHEKHELAIDLIDLYHAIAKDTIARLREQHAAERRKKDGLTWRAKMRGLKIAQDDDEMEDEPDPNGFPDSKTTLEDLERWEQEAQTWDLLRRLVQLRFPLPGSENNNLKLKTIHQFSSEEEVWDNFLATDQLALERKTVLQWLKDTAEETGEDIDILVQDLQQNAERGDIIAHGWLHTKAAIKNQKRLHAWPQILDPSSPEVEKIHLNSSRTEPLITQLDPDAVTRQNRKLETQDEYFERAIWLGCYEMLRRGRHPNEIKEWCTERTEVWRAISMSGLPDDQPANDEVGNPVSSALWRRTCYSLARNGGGDEYERAVYGILSGDVWSVEPICKSWDDFIFTHYNALLRAQFDNFLRIQFHENTASSTVTTLGAFDAVHFHGDDATAGKTLIENLKRDPRTLEETLQPMKMLQGVLIANQFEHFVYQQGLALSKLANEHGVSNLIPPTDELPEDSDLSKYISLDDHDSLRVLTHVLLIFISLGWDLGGPARKAVVEHVLVSYISFLRLAGKEELIPLYCSQLSGNRRYATLSRSLIDVIDREQRVTQLKLMKELGLDAQQFVKYQSRYLLGDYKDPTEGNNKYPANGNFKLLQDGPGDSGRIIKNDFLGDDSEKVERVDLLLIRSLEWYLLVNGLWSETFKIGTILYLRFFRNMHLNAARLLASQVSSSDIARAKTQSILGESLDFNNLEFAGDDDDLTEVIDGSTDKKRLLKTHLLGEAKNFRELEALIESLDHIETLTSMGSLMYEVDSTQWQKGWRQALARAVQPAKVSVKRLLKGWLCASQQEETAEEFRQLRESYLPETILAYINTLQNAGMVLSRDLLLESMDLSALIAAEGSDVLELFVKTGKMQELVEAFALAGKTLLILTSNKPSGGSKSKRLRSKGWTSELWSVKS